MSLNNHTIYLFLGFQLSAFQKSVIMSGPQGPAAPPLPLEGLAGRLASLSKQLGPPIGPSGPQLPPCPPAPNLSTVGQSHQKPVVPNVEYQRSLNSLASSIHSTPSTAPWPFCQNCITNALLYDYFAPKVTLVNALLLEVDALGHDTRPREFNIFLLLIITYAL